MLSISAVLDRMNAIDPLMFQPLAEPFAPRSRGSRAPDDIWLGRLRAPVDRLADTDWEFGLENSEATEREFQCRKARLVQRSRDNPLGRVAAFLLCISCQNAHEGLDAAAISDDLNCAVVAGYLGMDVAGLGRALVAMERMALIERVPPSGLRLVDLCGLERLSDGQS